MKFWRLISLLGVSSLVHAGDKKQDEKNGPTTFNGVEVPPLIELTPETYEKMAKEHKFLMVKHYR
jgi:protein disulfide-isomerase